MNFLKRLFAPPEVRAVLRALPLAEKKYRSSGFRLVKGMVQQTVSQDPDAVVEAVQGGVSPPEVVYTQIVNIAGRLLESGRFNLLGDDRNPLNPLDPTPWELLDLHDAAIDELLALGALDEATAQQAKDELRKVVDTSKRVIS